MDRGGVCLVSGMIRKCAPMSRWPAAAREQNACREGWMRICTQETIIDHCCLLCRPSPACQRPCPSYHKGHHFRIRPPPVGLRTGPCDRKGTNCGLRQAPARLSPCPSHHKGYPGRLRPPLASQRTGPCDRKGTNCGLRPSPAGIGSRPSKCVPSQHTPDP